MYASFAYVNGDWYVQCWPTSNHWASPQCPLRMALHGWLFVETGFFRLCQGEPLCATCAALHRLVTLGTVLELKVLACAIIRH